MPLQRQEDMSDRPVVQVPDSSAAPLRRAIAAVVFLACVSIHAVVVFRMLTPVQLSKYNLAAQMQLQGTLPPERLLDLSPLYLKTHVLSRHFGLPPTALQWANILLVGASAVALFLLLCRYFNLWIALAGSLLFLTDTTIIVYEQIFEPECFMLAFLSGFLFFATLPGIKNRLLSALFFCLMLWTRPVFLPLLPLALVSFYFQDAKWREWMRSGVAFGVPVLLALVLLWVRNTAITGYFTPMIMNPGSVIFEGNNPLSRGQSSIYPPVLSEVSESFRNLPDYQHELYRVFARRIAGKPLTIPQVNAYWLQKVIHFASDHPRRAFQAFAGKLFLVFHGYQWHDISGCYWNQRMLRDTFFPTVPFSVISALAVVGLILCLVNWKEWFLFYGAFLSQAFSMVLIYVQARHRMAITPIFILFACGALAALWTRRKALAVLPLVVLLCVLLQRKTDIMREEDHLWEGFRISSALYGEAVQLQASSKFAEAARSSAAAAAVAPWLYSSRRPAGIPFPDGYGDAVAREAEQLPTAGATQLLDRAVVCIEAGQDGKAAGILTPLAESSSRFRRDQFACAQPSYYLARIRFNAGRPDEAEALLKQALEKGPGDPFVLAELSVLTGNAAYGDALFRYFDDIDAEFFLGQACLNQKKPAEAARHFEYVTQKLPEFRRAHILQAVALGRAGDYDGAARAYREAMKLGMSPALLEEDVLRIFRGEATQKPGDAFTLYSYGVVLRQFGHFKEALEQQQAAAALDPSNAVIQKEIRWLKAVALNAE